MASFKVDGFVKSFRGSAEEFVVFWEKFNVLADIQGWKDDETKLKYLPLFLEGDAFLVFSSLSDADKKSLAKVRGKLEGSFCVSKAQAYKSFTARRLRQDESVDAYAADLHRLASLAGLAVDDKTMLAEQFVSGLPGEFAKQVRLSSAGKNMTLDDLLEKVRALRVCERDHESCRHDMAAALPREFGEPRKSSKICFVCKNVGHIARDCPQKQDRKPNVARTRELRCYFCDEVGHTKQQWLERASWLSGKGKPTAALTNASTSQEQCLCTIADPLRAGLPKIFVDVGPHGEAEDVQWERF